MDQNTSLHRLVFQKLKRPIPACWSPLNKGLDLNTISYTEKGGEPTCPECKEMGDKSICPSEVIATMILKQPGFETVPIPMTELANLIDKSLKEMTLL